MLVGICQELYGSCLTLATTHGYAVLPLKGESKEVDSFQSSHSCQSGPRIYTVSRGLPLGTRFDHMAFSQQLSKRCRASEGHPKFRASKKPLPVCEKRLPR